MPFAKSRVVLCWRTQVWIIEKMYELNYTFDNSESLSAEMWVQTAAKWEIKRPVCQRHEDVCRPGRVRASGSPECEEQESYEVVLHDVFRYFWILTGYQERDLNEAVCACVWGDSLSWCSQCATTDWSVVAAQRGRAYLPPCRVCIKCLIAFLIPSGVYLCLPPSVCVCVCVCV